MGNPSPHDDPRFWAAMADHMASCTRVRAGTAAKLRSKTIGAA
jgi:hypothetical protein